MVRALLVFLTAWILGSGQAQTAFPLPPELQDAISDYLQGEGGIAEVVKRALEEGPSEPCYLPTGDVAMPLRKAYDLLVLAGRILCSLKVTCLVDYLDDIFPLPVPPDSVRFSVQNAEVALLFGRWYHMYAPLQYAGEAYLEQKGLGYEPKYPRLLLAYPDVKLNFSKAYEGVLESQFRPVPMGDREYLEGVKEGDLIRHLPISWNAEDPIASKVMDTELAYRAALDAMPGFILVRHLAGTPTVPPARTVMVLGSTAPPGTVEAVALPSSCGGTTLGAALYVEFVGQIPQYWNNLVGIALPILDTLTSFSEKMEKQEEDIRHGRMGGTP